MSYSQTCDTSRATDRTAVRTGCGSPSLVGFNVSSSVPAGLVAELIAQRCPTCIMDGFSHLRFCKFGRTDITDDDESIFTSELGAPLVQMMTARVSDLGVDRTDAALVASASGNGQGSLILTVMLKRGNDRSIRTGRYSFQPKVNSDLANPGRELIGNLTLKADVPAPSRVLNKRSSPELPVDSARSPETEFPSEIEDVRLVYPYGTWDKRYPAQGSFGTEACAEARTTAMSVTSRDELPANCLHSIGMQAEISGAPGAELYEIEGRRPAHRQTGPVSALSLALSGDTEVPNLIAGDRVASQVLASRPVLDAKFVSEDHSEILRELTAMNNGTIQ